MKCATCDIYIEPSYMPCPQCKRRAGYTIIEDTSRCDDIFELAYTLINADQVAQSRLLPINVKAIVDKSWWVAASEGSLSAREIEGLEGICQEKRIDKLIAVLPGSSASENESAEDNAKVALGLAFVETTGDALRNFGWDYPGSFLLFPTDLQFFVCQYEHPALLSAGPRPLIEKLFNLSVEASVEQFKEDMQDSQSETFAAYLIENIIEPANGSAAH
jgi:hypothetical protein